MVFTLYFAEAVVLLKREFIHILVVVDLNVGVAVPEIESVAGYSLSGTAKGDGLGCNPGDLGGAVQGFDHGNQNPVLIENKHLLGISETT